MVTRILSVDIPQAFLKKLGEESPFIVASMFMGFGIAAIDQVSRQNGYVVDGDNQTRISKMVSIHCACLFASGLSSAIASRHENSAFFALAAVSLGGAFWSLRQIWQINSTRPDGHKKTEIDFAAIRTLLGLGAIIGAPCGIVAKLAFSYSMSQRV